MTRRRVHTEPRRFWSVGDDALLRELYPDMPTVKVARRLRRSLSATYGRAGTLGLAKSAAYLASPAAGRTNGRQGIGTRFRKGERRGVAVKLYKPLGAERTSKDGYLERKINDGLPLQRRWRAVHLLLWESVNGPLPSGHAVKFVNGDRTDIRLENLKLVTRAELMKRNSYHNLPSPLPHMIQLIGAVNRKINRRTREEQNRRPA